jgi:capsular exopolysaccharide synthesis family protein
MTTPPRSRHPQAEYDDPEDPGFSDDGASQQARREKTHQLLLDLLGRWHWIVLGLILGFLAGAYHLSKAPKLYQARTTLLIKQQTASVMNRDRVEEIDLRSIEAMNTVAARITRPELLEKVATRPEVRALEGLMAPPVVWLPDWLVRWIHPETKTAKPSSIAVPPPPALGGIIGSWTTISIRQGTRLMDILVTHPTPDVARAIADAIAIEYQTELTSARSGSRSSSLQILVEESEAARKRLQTAQNALAIYQRALLTLKELETREAAVAALSRRYLAKHPRMVSANAELANFQQRFLEEFDAARTSSADRDYWDGISAEWSENAGDPTQKLLTARRLLLARGNVLESEITSQTTMFNSILTRIQEADINQQAVESELEISSYARLPGAPISPVARKVLTQFTLGGLAFGVLLALLFIRIDNKIHTVAQLEQVTGLPTLAAIPAIPAKLLAGATREGSKSGDSAACAGWNSTLLFHSSLSSTTFAEMFRVLRASVSLLGDEKKRRITLFTSALPGEGKTFISCNFALAAASQGKSVLLVDLDLRRPAVHKLFGLQRDDHHSGASEVLAGQAAFNDAIITGTGVENLHLMLAGAKAPNPGELLSTGRLRQFFDDAMGRYDLIVLDSAPLFAVPDTRIIASLCHNLCLVARAEFIPKGAIRRVIAMLDADHNPPSGVVFNCFTEKRRLISQNYSYGSYQTNRYGAAYRYGYGSYGASYGSDAK